MITITALIKMPKIGDFKGPFRYLNKSWVLVL